MLTGLVNRREFERLLERTIRRARSGDGEHVLFYIDLDQF
jgi:GGDEF domain-containing protein